MLRWLWLSALVVGLDQVTKLWAEAALAGRPPLNLLPHLDLRLAYNTGAAFSFLSDAGGWQRWFFVGLASLVSGILLVWLARLPARERLTGAALALVIGGAVGNLIDRLLYGHVIDFIDVYWDASLHWPAFNIADSAISVGVVLLVAEAILTRR
jgi:signal peptidase II